MRVVVIGAGVGGLAAGVRLAAAGHAVTVLEAAAAPGGKCGRVVRDGFTWDSGPSLLTMPWVFEALFAETGAPLGDELELLPVEPVTRYRFADGSGFDLSADAGALARRAGGVAAGRGRGVGPLPRDVRGDVARVRGRADRTGAVAAAAARGRRRRRSTSCACKPWWTLRQLARAHTDDPRLRMVIERFATYAGADPRRAPAALAVAGYVEHAWGAWHPRGGMYALVEALARRLAALGGELRLATPAQRIVAARADAVAGRAASRRAGDGARPAARRRPDRRAAPRDRRRHRRRLRGRGRGRHGDRRRRGAPRPARPAARAARALALRPRADARPARPHAGPRPPRDHVPRRLRRGVRRRVRPPAPGARSHGLRERARARRIPARRPRTGSCSSTRPRRPRTGRRRPSA